MTIWSPSILIVSSSSTGHISSSYMAFSLDMSCQRAFSFVINMIVVILIITHQESSSLRTNTHSWTHSLSSKSHSVTHSKYFSTASHVCSCVLFISLCEFQHTYLFIGIKKGTPKGSSVMNLIRSTSNSRYELFCSSGSCCQPSVPDPGYMAHWDLQRMG